MQQGRNPRRTSIVALAMVLALSVGAGALALIELPALGIQPIPVTDPVALFEARFAGLANTGFSIRSVDGSLLEISGLSEFKPEEGLQDGETVQDGFVLLDGTLTLQVSALADGRSARTRTTYRFGIRLDPRGREDIARALFDQGLVRDMTRARARARFMRPDDARVMRLVERRDGSRHWVRAVRALGSPERMRFRPRTRPDGILGHFGTAVSDTGSNYVWAVMDRNNRYAVGFTVDRDHDGVPNIEDNCIGTDNSNQNDLDKDLSGDACDVDDDNDSVLDAADNCPLSANANQSDLDGDGIGDACDADDDNDSIADGVDQCLASAVGAVVDATGCSIADLCPCESDWRNHGAYVKCVARTSEAFVSASLITAVQKDAIVSAGAQSSCGVKP